MREEKEVYLEYDFFFFGLHIANVTKCCIA